MVPKQILQRSVSVCAMERACMDLMRELIDNGCDVGEHGLRADFTCRLHLQDAPCNRRGCTR